MPSTNQAGDLRIRRFVDGDETALLAIFQSSVRGQACRDYSPEQIDAWAPLDVTAEYSAQWRARMARNRPWVLSWGGRLAAFADLQASGHIDQFFVATEFAGRGIGTALMLHLLEAATSGGIARLSAHVSLTAQPFFRRFGFTVEEERLAEVNSVTLRNAVMSKIL